MPHVGQCGLNLAPKDCTTPEKSCTELWTTGGRLFIFSLTSYDLSNCLVWPITCLARESSFCRHENQEKGSIQKTD